MIRHQTLRPPEHLYPVDPWKFIETRFYPRFLAQSETIFSVGNGYLGMRGNFEEGAPVSQNGTFINGFHETWPIVYGEEAYGFAKTGQTMLNVTDGKIIKLYVDDEPFFLPTALLLKFERCLDMQAGTLDREVLWETPAGKHVLMQSRRLVSLQHRHLAAMSYQVTVLNAEAPVVIASEALGNQPNQAGKADPRQARGFAGRVLYPQMHYVEDRRLMLTHMTGSSKMTLACGVDHMIDTTCPYTYTSECADDAGRVVVSVEAQPGEPIRLVKYVTYHTSRSAPVKELCARAQRTLDRAVTQGFDALLAGQRQYMDDFWYRSDVQIEADPAHARAETAAIQQVLRWNLFQLCQATARAEGTGVPAKGLTGQTYEGHYFWDTEIYVMPFLIYTAPRIARNLLKFRHSMLDQARQRACEVNQKGALFPWRTINGEEASAYYAAGTAQYHINADIIYALWKYFNATGDEAFRDDEGVEMLVETARLWQDLGFFSERQGGKFCIRGVTGPDEYNTVVNNNAYTNLMARENLWYAVATVEALRRDKPALYDLLVDKTGLVETEIEAWKQAADAMYVPYDEATGIIPQDDDFMDDKPWDFANTPPDKYPLLLSYHPLVIYRHKVIKQADIVLAMFLLGDEFSLEQKRRNFAYYEPLTTGDSSLSVCIEGIMAFEIGDMETALVYTREALLMDLGDVAGNVHDGCHVAAMGGSWMLPVYGVAGMRDYDGHLSFQPRLPRELKRLQFPLIIRGQRLEVDISKASATYLLREGTELSLTHQDQEVRLTVGNPVSMPLQAS
jgi:alpha,alpha-trehalose phosphorylase